MTNKRVNRKVKRNKKKVNTETFTLDKNAIDHEQIEEVRVSMTPDAIPDLDKMMKHVDEMLDLIESPEMQRLEKKDKQEFERIVYGQYNSKLPMKIIGLMVESEETREDNLNRLCDLFDVLGKVKRGERDIHEEHKDYCEKLNNIYVYPKFGGKEGFENKMKELEETHKNDTRVVDDGFVPSDIIVESDSESDE